MPELTQGERNLILLLGPPLIALSWIMLDIVSSVFKDWLVRRA